MRVLITAMLQVSKVPLGGQRGHAPPKMSKSSCFALHMQYVINLRSKTDKIYTQYVHF